MSVTFRFARVRAATVAGLVLLMGTVAGSAAASSHWSPSARGSFIAEPAADDDIIQMSNGFRFDPVMSEPTMAPNLVAVDPLPGARAYYLVQGHAPLASDFADAIRAMGGEPLSYISHHAFVVRATPAVASTLRGNAAVRWVGAYHPAYRLSAHLIAREGTPEKILVKVFDGADAAAVESAIRSMGAMINDVSYTNWNQLIIATVDGAGVAAVARMNDVEWIEPSYPAVLDNQQAQWVIQTNTSVDRKIWDHGITGVGQVANLSDTGISMTSCFFSDPSVPVVAAGNYPTHRKVIGYANAGGGTFGDSDGHGSHTSGTVAGNDSASTGYDGMAKDAKLYFSDIGVGAGLAPPGDLNTMFLVPFNGNPGGAARVSSNSWGTSGSFGVYTAYSQQADQFMWNHKDFLICFSDGNDGPGVGEVHAPATAKDIISGGGSGNGALSGQIYAATSRGPCDDGRQKPTLCAPASVTSVHYSLPCGTRSLAGTSMATPALAGGCVLIRQYLTDGFYPSGTATPADAISPSAALVKAIAVNSGSNSVAGFTSPDDNIGWGRMLLDDALYFPGDSRNLLLWDEATGISTGGFEEFQWVVTDPTQPLEVTVCWTDYQGNPASGVQLVNDLNLLVTEPDGTTQYRGNNYSGGQSVTGGAADNRDVEECARRNTPTAGLWTARVSALTTPHGPQPFAIVVTGGIAAALTSVEGGATPAASSGAQLLASTSPNPVVRGAAGTVIRYYLPTEGDVRLGIFDVAGREVRRIVTARQPAGQQAAAWDAKDVRGHAVPSGVYFYRLETPSGTLKAKVIVSR